MDSYIQYLVRHFWDYRNKYFENKGDLFDRPNILTQRPPVFKKEAADNNVLLKKGISEKAKKEILNYIPLKQRHRWFRSMKSSQALAQSIFANLKALEKLECLSGLKGDNGKPLFIRGPDYDKSFCMEFSVDYLGEPRPTNIDVYFNGDYRIAIECKLTEPEVGSCSRPHLTIKDQTYKQEYCNGQYSIQCSRKERCVLSSLGIRYWGYVPQIFNWATNIDQNPCPINETYQLVRNILAVCVRENKKIDTKNCHVVLLYDLRNPAFKQDGKGWNAWQVVKKALRNPELLQLCTWQEVIDAMRGEKELSWLICLLHQKYGF